MFSPRVIPALTLIEDGLYRTKKFKKPSYVGDPLNAVRIFNEKEVDELIVLDISPERGWHKGRSQLFAEMASEAFMPMAFGGNIQHMEDIEKVFSMGYDKAIINSAAITHFDLIKSAAERFGGQSIVVSIDVGQNLFRKSQVFTDLGRKAAGLDPVDHAMNCEKAGAGEIIIRSIEHDGLMEGFDMTLISNVANSVSIPVVATGGAGSLADIKAALNAGAHSVCAGSMFVYHGPHRAVLINYPNNKQIEKLLDLPEWKS